ncbi:MAG: hypothetical protein AAGF31_09015 [Planctomycetota bacterium]
MFGYVLDGDTSGRDYTVIDFTSPRSITNLDEEVNFIEYVRKNFTNLVAGIPPEHELLLIAGGHAHNPGLVPLLVLWAPLSERSGLPHRFEMIETVDKWCDELTFDEVRRILNSTYAPTWEQLQDVRRYPHR